MTRHSAIFMEGDGDQLISPSSCSQVLDATVTHTKKSYAEQLECAVITGTEFINRKTGLKREVSHPRFLWGCNQGGDVLNFFFFSPCSSESSKLGADHCKGHCHICWKSNHWYQHCKHKFENPGCLHRTECIRVKNRFHLASYLHNKHVSFKCLIWYSH